MNAPSNQGLMQQEVFACSVRLPSINAEGRGVLEHMDITRGRPTWEGDHRSIGGNPLMIV